MLQVKRYQGVAHQPPTEMGADEQTNRLRNIKCVGVSSVFVQPPASDFSMGSGSR